MCLGITNTKLILGPEICASQTHITYMCLWITNTKRVLGTLQYLSIQLASQSHMCLWYTHTKRVSGLLHCWSVPQNSFVFVCTQTLICVCDYDSVCVQSQNSFCVVAQTRFVTWFLVAGGSRCIAWCTSSFPNPNHIHITASSSPLPPLPIPHCCDTTVTLLPTSLPCLSSHKEGESNV